MSVNLSATCSECQRLKKQLKVATDLIVDITNRKSESFEMLHELDKAHEERNQVLRDYVEHLKAHKNAAA